MMRIDNIEFEQTMRSKADIIDDLSIIRRIGKEFDDRRKALHSPTLPREHDSTILVTKFGGMMAEHVLPNGFFFRDFTILMNNPVFSAEDAFLIKSLTFATPPMRQIEVTNIDQIGPHGEMWDGIWEEDSPNILLLPWEIISYFFKDIIDLKDLESSREKEISIGDHSYRVIPFPFSFYLPYHLCKMGYLIRPESIWYETTSPIDNDQEMDMWGMSLVIPDPCNVIRLRFQAE